MAQLNTVSITWDDRDRPLITVSYTGQDDASEVNAEEWLVALAERLTDKSAKYLRKLLDLNADGTAVSLAELATALGDEKREVDGWNRNLGRSVKAIVRDYGFLRPEQEDGTAQVFDFKWDNPENLWRYVVPEKFRPILIDALDKR